MAEAVVSIAGEIVASLAPRALQYAGELWGVKDEVRALRDTVSTLQAVLDHAEEQYHRSSQIRVWVDNLKEAFYDAQDVLEELCIETMRLEQRSQNEVMKEVKTFFSSSNQLAFKIKMSYKLRAVRRKIEAVKADKGFHLDERPEREWRKREATHSFVSEGDIKGRDDDKKKVIDFLMDSDEQEKVSVLPIVGIGGLGKTALAQLVYNDERVKRHFDLKIWVCVSDDFDMIKIIKNMIACAKKKEPTEVVVELLQSELRALIDGKRYLLILDDLWNEEREKWLRLKALLMGGAGGSKVLITTRLPLVAKITGTALPHSLEGLSETTSFELLMQMACRREGEIQDPEMLAIGREIAKKCCGVPLVVRTVGSLLFLKESKLEWSHFKDKELPNVCQTDEAIESVLRLSYNHLPSHLKQCFAFCSLFPKDFVMNKQTLVNLWMAQGFIQRTPHGSQNLEDIAHGYFMDLLWNNFFQDYNKDPFTDRETCKMHDLMHDLACLVAGTEYWVAWDNKTSIHERTYHISYGSTFDLIVKSRASALRTFLSHSSGWLIQDLATEAVLCNLIQSFKRLRILALHGARIKKVPRSICKLKHLTYLDLSSTLKRLPNSITRLQNLQTLILSGCWQLKELPRSIGKLKHLMYLDLAGNQVLKRLPNSITGLQNLQTLDLDKCRSLEELPRDINKLVSLRNLCIDDCPNLCYVPCGIGQLSSLRRLTRFILPKDKALAKNGCRLGELNRLNDICGSLRIENLESVTNAIEESKSANLIGKHSLLFLALCWTYCESDDAEIGVRDEALLDGLRPHWNLKELRISGYGGERFSRWMMDSLVSSLPNLVEVRLWDCFRCKHLPPLGQLPHLKRVWIHGLAELEYIMEPNPSAPLTSSFPSLLTLEIYYCGNLKALPPIPNVLTLHIRLIRDCGNLEALPPIPNVLTLHIFDCGNLKALSPIPNVSTLHIFRCGNLKALPPLPCLLRLTISYCENLKALPPTPHLEELTLYRGNNKEVINMLGLCKLKTLKIESMKLLECLPEECLKSLTSLQSLEIRHCGGLTSLSRGMRHLSNLVELSIDGCKELDICKDESGNILDFHPLPPLRSLRICCLPKLESLPPWLLQLTTLERLVFWECHNLKELPEQFEALQSLRQLYIKDCHSLTSLPEGMRRLIVRD